LRATPAGLSDRGLRLVGRRGPPPEPTALRLLKGNPGKRAINHAEPQPAKASKGSRRVPSSLPPAGKTLWKSLVPELERLNLLTKIDDATLHGACLNYARALQAGAQRVVDFIERIAATTKASSRANSSVSRSGSGTSTARLRLDARDGTRRYRTAYIEIPRKNGKSVKGSGPGSISPSPMVRVAHRSTPRRRRRTKRRSSTTARRRWSRRVAELSRFVRTFRNNISCERMGSKFEPLGADSSTLDGLNTHGLIEDETHAHTDRHVHDVLVTSMGARRQPLSWIITTAGVYDPESIGWELHERAVQVLEGVIEDDAFFALIYAADEGDDFTTRRHGRKRIPTSACRSSYDYMAEQCDRAKTTPSYLNTFLGITSTSGRSSANAGFRSRSGTPAIASSTNRAAWKRCWADWISRRTTLDLTALVLCFPRRRRGFDFLFRFWCPEETITERSKKIACRTTRGRVMAGSSPTPGNVVDYDFPKAESEPRGPTIRSRKSRSTRGTPRRPRRLAGEAHLRRVPAGLPSMSEPSKEFEKIVVASAIGHLTPKGVNPVMRWMLSNVADRRDPHDNIKPDKSRASGRIDGVVASIMALGRAMQCRPIG
jgi:hypothetical protein